MDCSTPGFPVHHQLLELRWFTNLALIKSAMASRWLHRKESTSHAGDACWISGSGRSPGEGNGNPLQYSCLGNPMDRGALQGCSPWGCERVGHDLETKQLSHRTDYQCNHAVIFTNFYISIGEKWTHSEVSFLFYNIKIIWFSLLVYWLYRWFGIRLTLIYIRNQTLHLRT